MPIDSDVGRRVVGLVQTIEDRKLYKGKGGEIMRAAVCHLIKSLCQAKIKYTEAELI